MVQGDGALGRQSALRSGQRVKHPRRKVFAHGDGFPLGCDEAVAGKDRLYGALDKALEHRDALMGHLQERWSDLFGAECQILLYDLTSTYFEGEAQGVESAARGYSRDHRPDTLQVVVALVVTPEGSRWPTRFSTGTLRT